MALAWNRAEHHDLPRVERLREQGVLRSGERRRPRCKWRT
jgi:hypothetical protein